MNRSDTQLLKSTQYHRTGNFVVEVVVLKHKNVKHEIYSAYTTDNNNYYGRK